MVTKRLMGCAINVFILSIVNCELIPASSLTSDLIFKAEFSRREIFVGELVFCHFSLISSLDIGEVEVAKFPEFTGFWKENLVLRQGQVPTTFGIYKGKPVRRAVIGSYILIPMVGEQTENIRAEPMKIVIRDNHLVGDGRERVLLSEYSEIKIKKLPPLPGGALWNSFSGAVGSFSLLTDSNKIPYKPKEPILVRFILQGQGNFYEISRLPILLPNGVALVSQRSFTQSVGTISMKTFDIILSIEQPSIKEISEIPFIFFDPIKGQYQKTKAGPLVFVPNLKEAEDRPNESQDTTPPPPEKSWRISVAINKSGWFWGGQAFILLSLVAWRFHPTRKVKRDRSNTDRLSAISKKMIDVERVLTEGSTEDYLKLADSLAFEILCVKLGLNGTSMSRASLLHHVEQRMPPMRSEQARSIFEAYQEVFSPFKKSRRDLMAIQRNLRELLAA